MGPTGTSLGWKLTPSIVPADTRRSTGVLQQQQQQKRQQQQQSQHLMQAGSFKHRQAVKSSHQLWPLADAHMCTPDPISVLCAAGCSNLQGPLLLQKAGTTQSFALLLLAACSTIAANSLAPCAVAVRV